MLLHLIPASVHRAALRLAHRLRKRWWWRRGRLVEGSRVVALNGRGEILLIRHSYGSGLWATPGGGMKRGEDPRIAAARELQEETACVLTGAVEIAVLDEPLQGAVNRVHIVAGRVDGAPRADRREVMEAAFFALDRLPDRMPARLRADLPGWVTAAKAGHPLPARPCPGRPAPAPPGPTG